VLAADSLNDASVFGFDAFVGFCCAGKGGGPEKKKRGNY